MASRNTLRIVEWVVFRILLVAALLGSFWGTLVGYVWIARRVRAEVGGSTVPLMVILGLTLVALCWAAMEIADWHNRKRGLRNV